MKKKQEVLDKKLENCLSAEQKKLQHNLTRRLLDPDYTGNSDADLPLRESLDDWLGGVPRKQLKSLCCLMGGLKLIRSNDRPTEVRTLDVAIKYSTASLTAPVHLSVCFGVVV